MRRGIIDMQVRHLLNAVKMLFLNWYILFIGILYGILVGISLFIVLNLLRGPFSILSGVFITIIISALISNFLTLIENIIDGNKLDMKGFKMGFKEYLWKIYGVLFMVGVFRYLMNILWSSFNFDKEIYNLLITLSFFILFNPLPEILYRMSLEPFDSIKYSIIFMKKHWLIWFIPNIVFLLSYYILFGNISIINIGISYIKSNLLIKYLIIEIILVLIMFYRGLLFKDLNKEIYIN